MISDRTFPELEQLFVHFLDKNSTLFVTCRSVPNLKLLTIGNISFNSEIFLEDPSNIKAESKLEQIELCSLFKDASFPSNAPNWKGIYLGINAQRLSDFFKARHPNVPFVHVLRGGLSCCYLLPVQSSPNVLKNSTFLMQFDRGGSFCVGRREICPVFFFI